MDSIELIVTALATGAALGATDTASSAVKDAYSGLKALVRKRLDGRPDGELVLARHEQAPDTWQVPLTEELDQAGAGHDSGLVAAAEALLRLAGEGGAPGGKYAVDLRGAQGVQVGDRNTQRNVFRGPSVGLTSRMRPGRLTVAAAGWAILPKAVLAGRMMRVHDER
jgi:hypothetical protein